MAAPGHISQAQQRLARSLLWGLAAMGLLTLLGPILSYRIDSDEVQRQLRSRGSHEARTYAESLSLYPDAVNAFLERGGIIAWGIVPAGEQAFTETVESLVDRLHEAIDLLTAKGVSKEALLRAGLVTPSDGTGSLSMELSERVFYLAAGVSFAMRRRYV